MQTAPLRAAEVPAGGEYFIRVFTFLPCLFTPHQDQHDAEIEAVCHYLNANDRPIDGDAASCPRLPIATQYAPTHVNL